MICTVLLDPGDRVWLEEPGYPGARSALVGAVRGSFRSASTSDGLDVDAGITAGADARMAYVTPSHQFPLGVPMSLVAPAGAVEMGERRRRVDCRGRLRQRISLRHAADSRACTASTRTAA